MSSQAATKVVKYTAFWRQAGMNYLDQLQVTSSALRKVLKEPLRTEVSSRSQYKFREFTYEGGKESPAKEFYSDPSLAKK